LPAVAPVTVTLNVQVPLVAMFAFANEMVTGAVTVKVPPHCALVALATVSPVGRMSAKPTPVKPRALAAGLVIVNVRLVEPFSAMMPEPKAFEIEGGASTLTLAEAVKPVPPSLDTTAPVTLLCVPAAMPVTLTENVQLAPAASDALDRLTDPPPGEAEIVPAPQEPVKPLGEETVRPAGSVSVKPMPFSVVAALLFCSVKLRLVEPLSGILETPNTLLIVGGETTVKLAVEVFPVPPLEELTVTLLSLAPDAEPCTVTETVHAAPGASETPDRLTEDDPSVAVAEPPQVLLKLPGVATIRPAGRESVNATPFRVRFTFALESVKLRLVVPLSGIVEAPNALLIAGGLITVRLADAVLPSPASVESMVTLFEYVLSVALCTFT